jgi:NADPH:quinone reductase-like Zn-dependent oxidoreductase
VRGFGFTEHGGPERLGYVDLPEPSPGAGAVLVRLRAAAFNRLDRFTLAGIPGVPVALPHVLGSDGAGVVGAVGEGVTGLAGGSKVLINPGIWDGSCDACLAGDEALCRDYRIVGEHTQGTATSFVVVPRRNVYPLPEGWSFEQGAAVPLVFQTAWRALATVGRVRTGQRVAVIGAGGGVATAVIQVAKLLGAQVAVTSRHAAKETAVRALGADAFLTTDDDHTVDRLLWEWSGKRGVDVIFDSVGAPTLPRSLRAVARGGKVVVIGATAGSRVELDVRTLFWRQAAVCGSTMAGRAEFEAVLAHLARGDLRPVIDSTYAFERATEAFERFDAPDLFGKVVLRLPTDGPD